jgi:hypothetical protein
LIAATLVVALGAILSRPLPAQPALEPATEESGTYVPDAGEIKTVAVVAVASYGELINDVGFVGSLGDRPELGQMLEGMIALFTQGKGLVSVDKTKPWGVILQTDGTRFLPVGCLPVTDFDGLLGVVQGFGVPITDGADGVKELSTPDGKTLYVKHDGGWAYVAQSADSLAQLPGEPEAALGQLVDEHDIGVLVSAQNVPQMYRQMAIQTLKAGMEDGLKRQEGDDDETNEAKRQSAEKQIAQLEQLINEIEELAIGWAVDADEQRTYLDVTYRFLAGSKMAQQIAGYGQPHTNFAGFYQPDAAVTMSYATQCDPELIRDDLDQMKAMIQTARKQAEKAIDEDEDIPDQAARDAFKAALGDFLDAAQATMEAGHMDGGAALHLRPGSLTFVAGTLIKQPEKIESGLKKMAAVAETKPDFAGVQWNAASHAGVNFHTLSVPLPEDEEDARKMFGDKVDVAVGIGNDTVYVAIGKDNLSAVNQAIDASSADPEKEVPPFEIAASLGQIMTMAATNAKDEDREMVQAIADMLNNQAQGRDHIRMTGKLIENGLRYRIEAEEGVLRAIGKAAVEAQRKAQQQAPQQAPQ